MSRCLLYTLYDVNYSLLVYHEQTVRSSYLGMENGAIGFTVLVGEPHAIYIHLARSVQQNVNDLVRLPSARLDLSGTSAVQGCFGEIVLNVEPHRLPIKEMCVIGNDRDSGFEQQIANTAYSVKSSGAAMNLGMGLEGAFRCWKVSVMSDAKDESYGLNSARDWSLAAVQLDEGDGVSGVMGTMRERKPSG